RELRRRGYKAPQLARALGKTSQGLDLALARWEAGTSHLAKQAQSSHLWPSGGFNDATPLDVLVRSAGMGQVSDACTPSPAGLTVERIRLLSQARREGATW